MTHYKPIIHIDMDEEIKDVEAEEVVEGEDSVEEATEEVAETEGAPEEAVEEEVAVEGVEGELPEALSVEEAHAGHPTSEGSPYKPTPADGEVV